jgi:hypothetical protein
LLATTSENVYSSFANYKFYLRELFLEGDKIQEYLCYFKEANLLESKKGEEKRTENLTTQSLRNLKFFVSKKVKS